MERRNKERGIDRYPPLSPLMVFAPSSSPLPYTVFAPTLFEFDPTKPCSPRDVVMSE